MHRAGRRSRTATNGPLAQVLPPGRSSHVPARAPVGRQTWPERLGPALQPHSPRAQQARRIDEVAYDGPHCFSNKSTASMSDGLSCRPRPSRRSSKRALGRGFTATPLTSCAPTATCAQSLSSVAGVGFFSGKLDSDGISSDQGKNFKVSAGCNLTSARRRRAHAVGASPLRRSPSQRRRSSVGPSPSPWNGA